MISLSASSTQPPEVRIHGGQTLIAKAETLADVTWLELKNEHNDLITVFLPPDLAFALAEAINSVNSLYNEPSLRPISVPVGK